MLQLVTTNRGEVLLKGEVMGSRLTNNLIMESERTHNGGVGVGVLQGCDRIPSERDGLSQKYPIRTRTCIRTPTLTIYDHLYLV